jgi:hypothetical protein
VCIISDEGQGELLTLNYNFLYNKNYMNVLWRDTTKNWIGISFPKKKLVAFFLTSSIHKRGKKINHIPRWWGVALFSKMHAARITVQTILRSERKQTLRIPSSQYRGMYSVHHRRCRRWQRRDTRSMPITHSTSARGWMKFNRDPLIRRLTANIT